MALTTAVTVEAAVRRSLAPGLVINALSEAAVHRPRTAALGCMAVTRPLTDFVRSPAGGFRNHVLGTDTHEYRSRDHVSRATRIRDVPTRTDTGALNVVDVSRNDRLDADQPRRPNRLADCDPCTGPT